MYDLCYLHSPLLWVAQGRRDIGRKSHSERLECIDKEIIKPREALVHCLLSVCLFVYPCYSMYQTYL